MASVIPEYIRPWTSTWWHTIWSWVRCGAALSHGAQCGRGLGVPVWSIWQFFPPWTVTRDVWHATLRRLVHRYRIYKDPFPHPALRDGVIPRLLLCVCRAMAIARLTHLRISVPSSGAPPGQVPAECFPEETAPASQSRRRRVSSQMRSPC